MTGIQPILLGPYDLASNWRGRVPSLRVLCGPYFISVVTSKTPFPLPESEGFSVCAIPFQGLVCLESRPEDMLQEKNSKFTTSSLVLQILFFPGLPVNCLLFRVVRQLLYAFSPGAKQHLVAKTGCGTPVTTY